MGFLRFQRRIGIAPGLRLNLSKSGVSLSAGVKGLHTTIGRAPRVTIGLPGSGLSYTTTISRGRSRPAGGAVTLIARGVAWLVGVAIGLAILAMIASYGG